MPEIQVEVGVEYSNGTFSYTPAVPATMPDVAVLNERDVYAVVFTLTGASWPPPDDPERPWIIWNLNTGAPPQNGAGDLELGPDQRADWINNYDITSGTSPVIYGFSLGVVDDQGRYITSPDPDIVLQPPG